MRCHKSIFSVLTIGNQGCLADNGIVGPASTDYLYTFRIEVGRSMSIGVVLRTALCLILLWCGSLPAQETTGTISGAVRDETGAVVPEAAVMIRNTGTGVERRVRSGGSGEYIA